MGDNDETIQLLTAARTAIDQAIDNLQPSGLVSTPEQFDQALSVEPAGHTINLASSFVYPRLLELERPIVLKGAQSTGVGRVSRVEALPSFQAGMRLKGDNAVLANIDVRHVDPSKDIIGITGQHIVLDRVRVLGDSVNGAKRGIAANGGDVTIVRSFVDNIGRVGQETQAVCSWDAQPGLTLMDSYLAAAGQSVLFGGADSLSDARVPRNITVQHCTLTKSPAWFAMGWMIKNALEFKAARDVLVDDCVLEYAGISQGQGAYLIVATPRNQGGRAPWSDIRRVTIQHCTGGYAGGVATMLGSDDNGPSGPLDGLSITDCAFHDIDPKGLTAGAGRLFTFNKGPANVTIDNVSVTGQNIKALGYFSGQLAPKGLKLSRLTMPASTYGWKLDGDTHPAGSSWPIKPIDALRAYMPDIQIDETIV